MVMKMAENPRDNQVMFNVSDRLFQQLTEFTETLDNDDINLPPSSNSDPAAIDPEENLTDSDNQPPSH